MVPLVFRRSFGVLFVSLAIKVSGQTNLRYIENKGQWPAAVTFKADAPGATIWVEHGSILIDRYDIGAVNRHFAAHAGGKPPEHEETLRHHAVRLKFIGATGPSAIEKEGASNDHFNFFIGNDPEHWASKVRAWAHITLKELYPGVDLVIHAQGKQLKYDLVFGAGVDPSVVSFTYEGADRMELRKEQLAIHSSLGEIIEAIPSAWQDDATGSKRPIRCWYSLKNRIVRILPQNIDPGLPLTIDPMLVFSTYSGSTADNFGYTATFDEKGFLYSGSSAFGQGYPTTVGAYETTFGGGSGTNDFGTDIAITKYDTTGTYLRWSTYLGGAGDDLPHSLICNANDELFVLGTTSSTDFPVTTNGWDQVWNGGTFWQQLNLGVTYTNGSDMIIARLSADGDQLQGSTFFGGSQNDGLNNGVTYHNYADEIRGEILLDDDDNVYVVSTTQSTDFPVSPTAYQASFGGGTHDGIAAKFDPMLTTLLWSTYFGGTGTDATYSCELGENDDLFITGGTTSLDMPVTPGVVGPAALGGSADAFIARLGNNGASLIASTYWGSVAYDQGYFVDKDNDGDIYIFGQTAAPNAELSFSAPFSEADGGQLLSKFTPDLQTAVWSSRFGNHSGVPNISPTAFLVDYCRRIYVAGWGSNIGVGAFLTTNGMGDVVTNDALQQTTDGNDFYIGVFDIDMAAIYYGTYFGGSVSHEHVDGGTSRFSRRGHIYESVCAGCGNHDDFPSTPGAWSATNNSDNCNNGVFKMDFDVPLVVASFAMSDTICADGPFTFTNLSGGASEYFWDFGDDSTSTATSPSHTYVVPGTYTVTLTALNPTACNEQDIAVRTVVVEPAAPDLQVMNDTLICGPVSSFVLTATSTSPIDFVWSTSALFTDTLNASLTGSTTISPAVSGTYYVLGDNGSFCKARDSVQVVVSLASPSVLADALICGGDTATLQLLGSDPGSTIIWSPSEDILTGQGTTTAIVSPDEQSSYGVNVVAPSGCSWSANVTVNVSPIFGSSVGASVDQSLVLPGTTVHLFATPASGVTYSWVPSGLVSDPTIANPTALITQTTTFTVTVTDGICTRSTSVLVKVYELRCDAPDIFVPNTFTPNGDGQNDVLFVRGHAIKSLEFMVFDRWGEKVFETKDQALGWDGTFEGKPVDPAVFVYHLTAYCLDDQRYFTKGNVTVVR